ncbi:PAS domain S-box protein [bacterium]|nr:PAS domain S-box protein [bacterium]
MIEKATSPRWTKLGIAALVSLALLLIDLQIPQGVVVGAAYVVVLFIVVGTRVPRDLVVAAIALSVLIWIGGAFSPRSHAEEGVILANRTLSMLIVCLVAWLKIRRLKLVAQLEGHQVELEATLRESTEHEQRFRQIVESVTNGMIMIDRSGRITLVNAEAERQFQYSRHELIGQPIEVLIPQRYRSEHPAQRDSFFVDPSVRAMGRGRELFALRRDGSEFPVEIGLNPVRIQDELFVLSSIVDITERRDAQQKIEAMNAELLSKNEEMQQFVYTVSHDLKSPLVTLEGFAGLLREELSDGNLDEALHCAERIERSTGRMGQLISDVLELSRVGLVRNDPEPINVSDLVADVCLDLKERLDGVGMSVNIQPDMPPLVADRIRLGQVFENLIGNAVKYGSSAPQPSLTVSGMQRNSEIVYRVADNGEGIPPQYHEQILRPFERLDSDVEGTGIGLAIVSRFVGLNGGRVDVDSAPGRGTAILLHFPLSLLARPTSQPNRHCDTARKDP